MPLRFPALAPWLAACAFAALSCGGASFDGRVFTNDELAFRVGPVPSEWRPIDVSGVLLAFRDDAALASVHVGGRCGKDGDDVPLEALTHHLFLHFTDRNVTSQKRVNLDGREALHTEIVAKLDGVPKHFSVFVLKKNGCVYDFVHVAPADTGKETRDLFAAFVEGFSTLSP